MPGDISITAVDVAAHSDVAKLAEGRGELIGLALWLLAERQKVPGSSHYLPSFASSSAMVCTYLESRAGKADVQGTAKGAYKVCKSWLICVSVPESCRSSNVGPRKCMLYCHVCTFWNMLRMA